MIEEVGPALEIVPTDTRTNVIVMRWLSFLMERMDTVAIPALFDFYSRIGWLGKDAAEYLASVTEGAKPEAPPDEEALLEEDIEDHDLLVKGEESSLEEADEEEADWRLTPEDHIKCWMFIMEIAGIRVDKNIWCDVDERISRFERKLADYYRV